MPIYLYKNPQTGEVKEILQSMSEPHVFSENGVEFERIFTTFKICSDMSPINPFSESDFIKKTNKKGTLGDLWDASAELSEKRKKIEGVDKIAAKANKGRRDFKKAEKEYII